MVNNGFFSLLFEQPKRDVLYEAAIKSLEGMYNLIKLKSEGEYIDLELSSEKMFTRVYPHNLKSPAIFWIDARQYIIWYPKNSAVYHHKMESKCKFVTVLKGTLYDDKTKTALRPGDKLKISPKDDYMPYTKDEECYIRVCIANCHSVFDDICK